MSDDYARPDSLAWQEIPQRPVHQLASKTLRHPFLYGFLLEELRPAYRVPGRRRDGSIAGERRVHWFLSRVIMPLRAIVQLIAYLLFDTSSSSAMRGVVTGPAAAGALSFADAHRPGGRPVWLLWSVHRAVLVHMTEGQPPRLDVLWSGEQESRPLIDTANAVLRWSDGSSIQLHLNNTNRELLAKQRSV